MKQQSEIPKDGFAGFKQNILADSTAGFVVFLLAMPLSLGIAKASEFPPIMGLVTAIVGGVIVSFLAGSKLTIKGPAAGLIVVVAGSVTAFGGGLEGWKLALGAMVVAGLVQILFGLLKLGSFADVFPLSAVHGMLAAIGLIIIIKQLPVLLNLEPEIYEGQGIVEMLINIPSFILNLDPEGTFVGMISLVIMLVWKKIPVSFLAKIPSPLVVLLIVIPIQLGFDFRETEGPFALLKVGNLANSLQFNADLTGMTNTGIFIKYVIMFALVGSLESLLTVKAVDHIDPYKRRSNNNKDLVGIGIGNVICACLGGLPMISEVARSSANVSNGAQTRWANFFHGLFILVFVLVAAPVIEMIPNAALAAMLIAVGIKLAHPSEFVKTYRIGWDQLVIFITTIIVTLAQDLLLGIAAGIGVKIFIHVYNGVPLHSFFKADFEKKKENSGHSFLIRKAAIFSNFLPIKKALESIEQGEIISIDLSQTKLVDHSVMDSLRIFQENYERLGGKVNIIGLEHHIPFSKHPLAGRKV
ncbi:SulP family inorganic anion transporter [Algoriphagus sediminis]|uniref:SulP family inorganic anion transporter n=1 Tax=Algoriphagus sediminis TaxID=3057113 RepID=A0ABT7YAZ5_9BACT|nr:SulP family inorganic anion transporter [Algoriphagus sediminis]MDN3203580.1 SulP family inorganic anion transporter [Algoriphagus sediminis]